MHDSTKPLLVPAFNHLSNKISDHIYQSDPYIKPNSNPLASSSFIDKGPRALNNAININRKPKHVMRRFYLVFINWQYYIF